MDAKRVEAKWQKKWEETGLYRFNKEDADNKLYCLEMFSYPSGAKLHVGHWYNYGPTDSWARFKRMQGYNVFHPMGFDAFGLPAENYAIKTGVHPQDSTFKNIETMERQLKAMGATFDWDYEIKTCMPDYYKWTQWIFLKLYEAGLAYRKEAPVNWCPSCNTVLANEQVVDGECERCHSIVERRNLTQWFFKITQYADELLNDLDKIDWPEKTKMMQRNWIGRSVGGEVTFALDGREDGFTVFTTRADTLYGCTYVVLAPEHPLVDEITTPENRAAVEEYQKMCARTNEIDRLSTTREKTGVFTGAYAVNPINGRKVPIWVADYVLYSYGTGAVMAVPAHDERDFAFATKYNLPIERVIKSADGGEDALPFCEDGVLVNSDKRDGLTGAQAREAILSELKEQGKGGFKVNYRLRDWLVSRQRYWGAPIPMIHCEHFGTVPVPEDQLPVQLPYDVNFTPDGSSPLAKHEGFMNTTCPRCGRPARRDPDTLDTFVCSSWYFLRYPNAHDDSEAFNKEWTNKLLPVDKYVGGAEHACMHLLYARFFTKALRDLGYLSFDEPFKSLVHQGIILGPDGMRMSKSRGNVISPDGFVDQYGSDVFRMYLMFGFAYTEGGPWNDNGIKSVARFLDRVERLVERTIALRAQKGRSDEEVEYVRHRTIQAVTNDTEKFQFNTAIARMMELVNALYKYEGEGNADGAYLEEVVRDLMLMMAPFAPHFIEELWETLGYPYSVFNQKWPEFDESKLTRSHVELALQIGGKVRGRITLESDATEEQAKAAALADEKIAAMLEGKEIKKVVVVPGRLVNIVAK